MKFSAIKAIKTFSESLFSEPCFREIVEAVNNEETDFEVDNVRFIASSVIDATLADEFASADAYVLGCFNASFIAGATGWPVELIEAAQAGEQFEAIGQGLIDGDFVGELASEYASADEYGHHFNGYDFGEEELTINGVLYHVFDNH